MKRTTSATIDRDSAGRRPSPDLGKRTGNDLTATTNLRTTMVRNNFTEDDSKSKNILAWAGRVKELIGTYDHGHDPKTGQLTRATGYSDLLAACGVDSGDVNSKATWSTTDQTSTATKPTNCAMNNYATTSPVAKQLVAEKDADSEDQAKQRGLPRSSFSMMWRREDQVHPTDRPEIRRASSSQDRGKFDYTDAAQKPPSRRTSQTEVKPAVVRDSSRSPDARLQSQRSPVGERPYEQTPRTGSSMPSSDNSGQHQSRKWLAGQNSKETPTTAKPTAICSFKQNDEAEKHSNKAARDVSSGTSARRSYDNHAERSTPTIRSSCHPNAEDRSKCTPRGLKTSDADDVNSVDKKTASRRVRSAERDWRPQETSESRLTDAESARTDNAEFLPRRASDRDLDLYQREPGLQEPTEESIQLLSERVSDLDMRRRAKHCPPEQLRRDRPSSQPVADRSRFTDAEPAYDATPRFRERDFENHQHDPRMPEPADVEGKNSSESFSSSSSSQRLSDVDLTRQSRYSPQRAVLPPQRLTDSSPAADYRDLIDMRDRTPPVRLRRLVTSDSSSGSRPRQKARNSETDLPPSTSAGRGTKPPDTTPAGPPSPRPILRKASPHQGTKVSSVVAEKRKNDSLASPRPRRCSLSPSAHARPAAAAMPRSAAVPLRRTAALCADTDDGDDNDDDNDEAYLGNSLAARRYAGRGLAKCSAVTDLSDNVVVGGHKITSNKRTHGSSPTPTNCEVCAFKSSVRSTSSSLTPRRIWEFLRPWLLSLHQLLRRAVHELFCMPPVVDAGQRVRQSWLRVMDDWALFTAVIFAVVCIYLVILLC